MVPLRPLLVRCAVSCLCLSTLVLVCGCGKSTGKVSGKVTLDGQPLTGGGTVTFEGSEGGVSGIIRPDGTYTIHHAPVGEVTIALASSLGMRVGAGSGPARPSAPPHKQRQAIQAAIAAPSQPEWPVRNIPAKYASPKTSGLTYTVKSGQQTFDIPLSSQ